MCTVQKWHTSPRRISLRRANCLAKINHMLAAGLRMLEATHMYRSSLTLAFVVLYSAAGAASDLSSVYVAPGGIYAPSADVYVRPGPAHRQRPYAEPGYGYRQPSYGTVDPAYRAPASVYGEYERPYAAQPVYVDRAPAYPERHYARERSTLRSLTTRGTLLRAGTGLCRRICAEAAAARALPCAGTMRRRLWPVDLLRLKPPALRGFVAADCDSDTTRAPNESLRAILDYRAGPQGGLATA